MKRSLFVQQTRVGRVFFYKQETAYEMRISDWSSDVCSSDLMPRSSSSALSVSSGAMTTKRLLSKSKCRSMSGRVPRPIEEFAGFRLAGGPGELGRASCRERVCQYG